MKDEFFDSNSLGYLVPLQYNPLLVKKKKKKKEEEEKPNERLENKMKEKGLTSKLKEGRNKEEMNIILPII